MACGRGRVARWRVARWRVARWSVTGWREAKPAAIAELGCKQVASHARKVRVARREAKPAAVVKLGCSQAASMQAECASYAG